MDHEQVHGYVCIWLHSETARAILREEISQICAELSQEEKRRIIQAI